VSANHWPQPVRPSLGIRVDIYFLIVDAVFFGLKRLLSGLRRCAVTTLESPSPHQQFLVDGLELTSPNLSKFSVAGQPIH